MPKNRLLRYLPSPSQLRENPALRPVAHLLDRAEIWHLNRRSASGAVFIGLFCAFLPVPMQMVIAAALAIAARCNLPLAVVLVWISNPVTIPPLFYFTYRLGAWLLDMQLATDNIEVNFTWLRNNLGSIGYLRWGRPAPAQPAFPPTARFEHDGLLPPPAAGEGARAAARFGHADDRDSARHRLRRFGAFRVKPQPQLRRAALEPAQMTLRPPRIRS
jgi:uncharacterized protein (DUF2062 family)